VLPAGGYSLTNGGLTITQNLNIEGERARTTKILPADARGDGHVSRVRHPAGR
jgi:hypothetical protein